MELFKTSKSEDNIIIDDEGDESDSLANTLFDFEVINTDIEDTTIKNNVDELCNSIIDQLGKDNLDYNFSKTGGCTIKVNNKKLINIVPKKAFIELLIMRDYKSDYIRPEISGLDISDIRKYEPTYDNHTLENPHPSYTVPWGYAFYKIKLKYEQISKYKNKINELSLSGYNTIIDNEVLKISMKNHADLQNIYGKSQSID